MMCVMHQEQAVDKEKIVQLKEAWMGTDDKDKVKLQGKQADYWRRTAVQ
jgi:hypothetical protein